MLYLDSSLSLFFEAAGPLISPPPPLTHTQVRREWFPSIVDIGIEINSHESQFDDLLPLARSRSHSGDVGGDSLGLSAAATKATEDAQAVLRNSSLLGGLPGGRARYALDWQSLRNLIVQIRPSEAEQLCLESTEDRVSLSASAGDQGEPASENSTTFNFDHVTSSYGDVERGVGFISEALLFPVTYLARSVAASTATIGEGQVGEAVPAIVAVCSTPVER